MLNWDIENGYFSEGIKVLCGCDEAGRGPLAGPVFAAAVILPKGCEIEGLNDSKKLSEVKRNELCLKIKEVALDYAVAHAEVYGGAPSKSLKRCLSLRLSTGTWQGIST